MTSAIVIAALVGASAAIIAQWVSQQLTTDRETRARRRKEERVRKLFAARVKTLAFYSTELANVAPGALATRDVEYSIQDMEEAFEPLAREFAIFELSLALNAEAIESFGFRIPAIQNLIRNGKDELERFRADGKPFDDGRQQQFLDLAKLFINIANKLLEALGEPPYKHLQ
jgi:hypothetical protein